VGGQKGGYSITVDWGDGEIHKDQNVGIARTAYQPTLFNLSHQWEEEGTYQVGFWVEDLTGAVAYSQASIVVEEKRPQIYEGEMELVNYGDEYHHELGQLTIDDSQVNLTVQDESVSAYLEFSYSINLYIYNLDHPDRYCRGYWDFVFSGEGALTTPLSLEMYQEFFHFELEGPYCDRVTADNPGGDGLVSTILTGNFYDDGIFYGYIDPDQYMFRYFGIFADLVE